MSTPNDFCVFILTHGRPDRVLTYDSLKKAGYTGRLYIVIDDEDKTEQKYRERLGDQVLQFCKADLAKSTDEGDNFNHRKAIVYARNACWDLARQVGCRYFVQFDDDYTKFHLRFRIPKDGACEYLTNGRITSGFDNVIEALLDFYKQSNADSICMAQGGDYIGGYESKTVSLKRKCMNSWFCDVTKPINFVGHMNEDVSAYVVDGRRGKLFLMVFQVMLTQLQTQATQGGMSDIYLASGTYVKSFYTVMAAPSCTKIGIMGDHRSPHYRIHHQINWHATVPKILNDNCRKRA